MATIVVIISNTVIEAAKIIKDRSSADINIGEHKKYNFKNSFTALSNIMIMKPCIYITDRPTAIH
jgi:hypothetical protein